ncbi:MAG: hypothetical protein A2033_14215 [Bacteroidetes bacterium GWA2_31_9]|nr:MAG: hypothetical protein A2033_14215 [Bacteroidetes bacterium GWA2_31_9]
MSTSRGNIWKNSMNYGAMVGFSLIIVTVLFYFLNITDNMIGAAFNYALMIIGLVMGTKNLRDKLEGGSISYARSLGSGVLISFFASIILGFYMYVFMKFIDPDFQNKMYEMMEERMLQQGLDEDAIERAMEMSKSFMTPGFLMVSTFFGFTFWGFLFSLIISIFVKKKNDSFDDAMREVKE